MVENAKFKAKYDKVKDKITTELKSIIKKLKKIKINTVIKNAKHDVENIRYDAENAKLKTRVMKLE